LLESYNPGVADTLLRTARIAEDDLAFLDEESARLWGEVIRKQENTIILDKGKFLELPAALKRHLLRAAIEKLSGSLKDIETRHIEEIMDTLTKPAGKRISLPEGLVFSVEYDKYLLGTDMAALSPFPILETEYPLMVPGETLIPGWRIQATIINREQMREEDEDFNKRSFVSGRLKGRSPFKNYFDADKAGDKLSVQPRRPGDRFQPLGMSQPKKLGEFMIDAKIPHAWRERIPLVCSLGHILWVVGWRMDDRVRVTENTKQVLCLKFERR